MSIKIALVERLDTYPELLRLAAHFIERGQSVVNIKHGILQPFGHDRPRSLLKLQNEMGVSSAGFGIEIFWEAEEQYVANKIEN